MFSKLVRAAFLSAFIFSASQVADASAEGTKFATINIQDIMTKSTAVQSINKQMEEKRNALQSQVSKKEEQLRNSEQELAKQRNVLSAEALEKKKNEFRDDVTTAQKDMQQKRASLEKGVAKAMTEVQKTVQKIVEDISKEKGFDAAIATNQLIFAKPEMDITPQVVEKLNKSLPDVKVVIEEGSPKVSSSSDKKESKPN